MKITSEKELISVLIFSLFFVIVSTTSASADVIRQPTTFPAEVREYATALNELQKESKRQSIEPVYALGMVVSKKLVAAARSGRISVLSSLSPDDFDFVQAKMKGFAVNREEVVCALPKATFFVELSKEKGLDVDSAFFNLLNQTRPVLWSVYIEQLTDFSGCTKHGSGLLVEFYGKWRDFEKQFPSAYTTDVRRTIGDIEKRLIEGSFTCGSPSDIITEMELFIKTYPDSEISEKLTERIKEIKINNEGKMDKRRHPFVY